MKILKLGLFLAIFGGVLASTLSFVNAITKDKIAENQLATAQEGLKQTIASADNYCTVGEKDCTIKDAPDNNHASVIRIYLAKKGKTTVGIIFETSTTNGFGTFTMLTGFNKDGDIEGWTPLQAGQSPGYGADLLNNGYFKKYIVEADSGKLKEIATGVTATKNSVKETLDTLKSEFNNYKGAF